MGALLSDPTFLSSAMTVPGLLMATYALREIFQMTRKKASGEQWSLGEQWTVRFVRLLPAHLRERTAGELLEWLDALAEEGVSPLRRAWVVLGFLPAVIRRRWDERRTPGPGPAGESTDGDPSEFIERGFVAPGLADVEKLYRQTDINVSYSFNDGTVSIQVNLQRDNPGKEQS